MSVAAPELVAPAFWSVPDHVSSAGAEAADLAEACGLHLDAEQRLILDGMFAEDARGRWAAMEAAVICPRQNLKTFILEVSVLADLFLFDTADTLVIWTAHLFPTAAEAFLDFKRLIDANEHLSRRVRRITEAAGNQGIELHNGTRLKFLARSKSGGRGLTGDTIILDEAFKLSQSELGSLLPTLSARPNPQVRYGSSAGWLDSDLLRGIRDRGRPGGDPSLFYAEWCSTAACDSDRCDHAVGEPGCVLDDPEQWLAANPAMHKRIGREFIAAERRALPPAEFARERLGWWDEPTAGRVIPGPRWAACANTGGVIEGPVAVFADVALDRSSSVIAVCGANADGTPQVEIAEMGPGTDWVAERFGGILDRHDVLAAGARGAGPVASLLPELMALSEMSDVPFAKVGGSDFAGMCGQFFDAVMSGAMAHRDDVRVGMALTSAKRHQVLDAWTWERTKVATDAAPLVAATGAHSLFLRHRRANTDPLSNIW